MKKTPSEDRDRKGGLRMQPRKEVDLQVLGNKNARGGTGRGSFLSEIGAIRWNLCRHHNPRCNQQS